MAVKDPVCSRNDLALVLDVTNGEKLLYEVTFEGGAQPVFAIVNQHGAVILSAASGADADGVYRTIWPDDPDAIEVPNDLTHTLGMHFVVATKYGWRVTRLAADDSAIEVHKDCKYESNPHSSEDEWFAPLRIFTK